MKNESIDISSLPREVRDIIELKEATDMTFSRFVDESYSEVLWNVLAERANPDVEHSMIMSVTGSQGCHLEGTMIQTEHMLKPIEKIVAGERVWSGGQWRECIPIVRGKQKTMKVTLRSGVVLNMTPDHCMKVGDCWKRTDELVVGDALVCGTIPFDEEFEREIIDSEDSVRMLQSWLMARGIVGSIVKRDENKWRFVVEEGAAQENLLQIESIEEGVVGEVFDLHVRDVHEYLANGLLSSNSGKSMAAIAMACFMDPNFSVDNIYFGYDNLVYNRHKLKPNSVVVVDEQSEPFGLDSHRIAIVLQNLKEQLRKKSIHFFFCAPTLYPESKTSMYILETMFIDYETQECYAALKTREGLTLGHVRIPYPLKVLDGGRSLASKELMDAYEAKKDAHLEKVLGQKNLDIFEERAEKVMENPLFKKAEKVYKSKMGYIPQGTLINIINKIFPEYQSGVVPVEIAGRIKLNKEISGEWEVSGRSIKKADRKMPRLKQRKMRRR